MTHSTTKFIAYDLRPSKQAERRLLIDFLKCANEAGLRIADCRYVGMGGTTFYDFHLMHRYVGIKRMVSLERDANAYRRSAFNCPFGFIKVIHTTAAEFLLSDRDCGKTIYWFDYEDGIGGEIVADIVSLATRITPGSLAFVTVYGGPGGALEKQNSRERLAFLRQEIGEVATGLTVEDVASNVFPTTVNRILVAAFANAFAPIHGGTFRPLFQVRYRDSSPMVTVGGPFCQEVKQCKIERRLKAELPFLVANKPYKIRQVNLTERERVLFDRAVTNRRSNSKEATSLRSMGFEPMEFDTYRDLIRFWPRYHEAMI